MYYKAESYIGSEYAGKILYEEGLTPVYVSDNPVLNAQHVLFEAAKGYKFGLPYHAALAAVTSAPAHLLGLGSRLGKIKPGYDADIVVWDSDPLSVGATPVQVWIDGTAQYDDPFELHKPPSPPMVPDPSLLNATTSGEETDRLEDVIFSGVTKSFLDESESESPRVAPPGAPLNVVVSGGRVACVGACGTEMRAAAAAGATTVRLRDGHLTPALTAFGATLGLNDIDAEASTDDGDNSKVFSRAADGLALDGKKLGVAHAFGVTRAITAPKAAGGSDVSRHGVSVGFATGARTQLDAGAVWRDDVAVHYTLSLAAKGQQDATPSVSSAVGALRRKLLAAVAATATADGAKEEEAKKDPYSEEAYLKKVVAGEMPLVVTAHSADTIAAVLKVKAAVEKEISLSLSLRSSSSTPASGGKIRLVVLGGAESHLVADALAAAGAGVVLAPAQSYATTWEQRRALPGAPLTNGTAVDALVAAGVTTALGLEEDWLVRDLALLAGVARSNGGGRIGERAALDLVSRNVYKMLGLDEEGVEGEKGEKGGHFVVSEGSPLEIGSRIRAVGGGLGWVSLFE